MSAFDTTKGDLPLWRDGQAVAKEAPRVWTVSEVNRFVRDVVERAAGPFWVEGEVSNLTIHRSGHVYLSLKDRRCHVSAVFFRGAEEARRMALSEGSSVQVYGKLSVYEPRGQYQVLVERIRIKGEGALKQQLEELKAKLRTEGLFDPDRKRALPMIPRTVGVVTSSQGAALHDFLNVINRRFSALRVRIVPAAVQGTSAASQVAAGIEFLNRERACDVIVVTRGGGSLEDLWPFNDESLTRAVARSDLPVISAVGHEVDVTLCDLAADLRAPTPSAAAELVVRTQAELADRIRFARNRLTNGAELRLRELENRVQRAAKSAVFREPSHAVRILEQSVDRLVSRAESCLRTRLQRDEARLERQVASLKALSPRRVLERGYAILTSAAKTGTVTDAGAVGVGDPLRAVLAKGELTVRVTDKQQACPGLQGRHTRVETGGRKSL